MMFSKFACLLLLALPWTASAAKEYRLVTSGDLNNTCVDPTSDCYQDLYHETEVYFRAKGWWPEEPPNRLRGRQLISCAACIRRFGAIVCEFFYDCRRRRDLKESPVTEERGLSSTLLGECQSDCDYDSECAEGLLCADEHKDELEDAGYDKRTAYCNVDIGFSEVCFDPSKVNTTFDTNSTSSSAASAATTTATESGLGECEYDCDSDSDCASGLLCADEHKDELAALGYDQRTAYCDLSIGFSEVCYDPAKLVPEVLEEDEWRTVTLSEVLAFLEEMKAHLLQFYDDIDRLQVTIQEKGGNVFSNGAN